MRQLRHQFRVLSRIFFFSLNCRALGKARERQNDPQPQNTDSFKRAPKCRSASLVLPDGKLDSFARQLVFVEALRRQLIQPAQTRLPPAVPAYLLRVYDGKSAAGSVAHHRFVVKMFKKNIYNNNTNNNKIKNQVPSLKLREHGDIEKRVLIRSSRDMRCK